MGVPFIGPITIAGVVLAATDNLTSWWGIAIMLGVGGLAALASLTSDTIDEASSLTDAIFLVPAAVGGVFLGWAVFGEWWGVLVGQLGLCLVSLVPTYIVESRLR